jgi:hypothetical protein
MTSLTLTLSIMPGAFAICRLDDGAAIPRWALRGSFVSVTRTADELSIVCPQSDVPEGMQCSRWWRCLRVEGPLDLSITGVLASLTTTLASARISLFAISTFNTDYLLVQEKNLKEALVALSSAGHNVRQEEQPFVC